MLATFRNAIFWAHLISGVVAGLVIFTMSITGVALTYEKQMAAWADGFEVQPPAADAPPLGPTAQNCWMM